MNFKNTVIFTILSFGITALVISTSNSLFHHPTFILTFAQENEAEVEANIEQENKCKKDSECENENELNNTLNIINKTQTETETETEPETGQLTVIKEITCQVVLGLTLDNTGFKPAVLQNHAVLNNVQFVPTGVAPSNGCTTFASNFEPQDFEFTVTGNNPNPDTFPGSDSGVVVTLGLGSYDVEETNNIPATLGPFLVSIDTDETGDCSGTISAGDSKTCTFTNEITLELPG